MLQLFSAILFNLLSFIPVDNGLTGYKIGDVAADFSLKGTDDKMHSLADFKDVNGYIVVFTCNSCPFAVMYEDRINELAKKYNKVGYPVIAINPNDPQVKAEDSFEKMKVRAKDKGFVFPYVFDDGQKVFPQYGATKTPHIFILDKNRKVQYIGALDDNAENASEVSEKYVENAIQALQAGKQPTPAETKAIGCSIKVKK